MATPARARVGTPLTEREVEILEAVSHGRTIAAIAAIAVELFLSQNTVKSHLLRINRKLGARGKTHAVAIGFRRGLLDTYADGSAA
ncbi:LuxR C-terminal-related transcriptional regulator [Streptomyces sp. NPDC053079]|uniref:LuxR C-terminal-related transcriptional regulator n=1 Tax=Streptomyces sp. NPDC053079 TaxID=3365697 RepID=UPI0037D4884B